MASRLVRQVERLRKNAERLRRQADRAVKAADKADAEFKAVLVATGQAPMNGEMAQEAAGAHIHLCRKCSRDWACSIEGCAHLVERVCLLCRPAGETDHLQGGALVAAPDAG